MHAELDSVLKSMEGILRQRPNLMHKGRSMNFVKFHIGNQKRKNKAVGTVNSKQEKGSCL